MTEMAEANSRRVLEQGDIEQQTKRPTSGRKSINKVPFKRSGSSLEIIPPDDNGDNNNRVPTNTAYNDHPQSRPSSRISLQRTSTPAGQSSVTAGSPNKKSSSKDRPPSRPSSKTSLHRSSSHENVRHSQSAGSSRKKAESTPGVKSEGTPGVNNDVKKILDEDDGRSSSAEARIERCETPPKKQVYLPSVRRNYEQHGMPKDDALDIRLRESLSSPIENAASQSNPRNGDHGNKATKENIEALLERLSMRVDGSKIDDEQQERKGSGGKKKQKSQPKPSTTELADDDAYYTSPGIEKQVMENDEAMSSKDIVDHTAAVAVAPAATDPYYISHGAEHNEEVSNTSGPSSEPQLKGESDEESSDDDDETDDEDEGPTAPIELLGEFVEAVMDEEWEDADKLCKMVLMYEPDNAEAKQFQPMIEEMLKREREEQLYGSDSDEEGSSDEDDSDEDDDDDEEEDSDEESSSSESESEDNQEEDAGNKEAEKREREIQMMKAVQSGGNDQLR